jgi:hypothetical protein
MYVLTVELVQMFARLKLSTQLNNTIYNKKYRLLSIEGSLFFHHRGHREEKMKGMMCPPSL